MLGQTRGDGGVDPDVAVALRRVLTRMGRELNASSSAEGLTPSQASVLALIAKRGPVGLSELAALEGVNPTMMSRIIGRLDDDRLIHRVQNQSDLRSVSVEVTPAGAELSDRIVNDRARLVARHLEALTEVDRNAIANALPALERFSDEVIRQRGRLD